MGGEEGDQPETEGEFRKIRSTTTSLRTDVDRLKNEMKEIRGDIFQYVSVFVGLLGIIFAIIISASFQADVELNEGIAIILLLIYIAVLNSIWLGLWVTKKT
jgi:hypothetical protein